VREPLRTTRTHLRAGDALGLESGDRGRGVDAQKEFRALGRIVALE